MYKTELLQNILYKNYKSQFIDFYLYFQVKKNNIKVYGGSKNKTFQERMLKVSYKWGLTIFAYVCII